MNRQFVVLLALAGVLCASASAAEPTELDPLVVTATRSEALASETLAAVTVITRAEIERAQAGDVAELLRFHAGLDIGRNGGPGQTTSVFIRGAESNHTLVLVDGVRINPGTIGGAALQNLAPDLIERIEIVKGPRSSQWGSDAIGGVIHIITRRPESGWNGTARVRGGSYDTWEGSLGAALNAPEFGGGIQLQQLDTGGFPTRSGSGEDSGHDNLSVSAFAAVPVESARLSAHHWQAQGTTEYLDFFLAPVSQDFRNSATTLGAALPLGGTFDVQLSLNHATDEIRQNQSGDYTLTRRSGVDWQNEWRVTDRFGLIFGANAWREEADSLSFGTALDVHTDVWGAFAQAVTDAGRHHSVVAARLTDHESFGEHVTGNVEYGFDVWTDGRLIASAGTAFRAPDATDRFGFGGNPDLEPEKSQNLEIGFKQRVSPTQVVSAFAFSNRIDNLIEFTDPDGVPFNGDEMNRNVDEAHIQGVEAAWHWQPGAWLIRLEGLVQDPINESTGERLARRAGKSLTAAVVRQFGTFSFGLDALAQGPREDSAFSAIVNGGYAVFSLTGSWQALPGLDARARIENVLDKTYQTAAGFNQPGAAGYLTLRYALQ